MSNLNQFMVIGNLAADPESIGKGEKPVVRVTVAVNRSRMGKDGKPETDFHRIKLFGKSAEFALEHTKKGASIAITGRFEDDNYTDKDGNKVWGKQMLASTYGFAGGESMGIIMLEGRLAKDPEIRYTEAEKPLCIARMTLAVGGYSGGEETCSFHDIVVMGKAAESIEKYLKKGAACSVIGEIHNESWEKGGKKQYATRVYASRVSFGKKPKEEGEAAGDVSALDVSEVDGGFMDIPDGLIEELPFN